MNKKCSIWWCDNKHYAKGYCVAHYRALKRYGNPFGKHAHEIEKMQTHIDALEVNLKLAIMLLDLCVSKQ